MLNIKNIEKIMGSTIIIRDITFEIVTVITLPNDYTIGIEYMGFGNIAPITVLLSRVEIDGLYRLQRAKGKYDYIELFIEEMETTKEFVSRLEIYLNTL